MLPNKNSPHYIFISSDSFKMYYYNVTYGMFKSHRQPDIKKCNKVKYMLQNKQQQQQQRNYHGLIKYYTQPSR